MIATNVNAALVSAKKLLANKLMFLLIYGANQFLSGLDYITTQFFCNLSKINHIFYSNDKQLILFVAKFYLVDQAGISAF